MAVPLPWAFNALGVESVAWFPRQMYYFIGRDFHFCISSISSGPGPQTHMNNKWYMDELGVIFHHPDEGNKMCLRPWGGLWQSQEYVTRTLVWAFPWHQVPCPLWNHIHPQKISLPHR